MNDLLKKLSGKKSYLAAIGLFGMAIVQFRSGQVDTAIQTALQALSVIGLRHAIAKTEEQEPADTNKSA